MAKQWPVAKSVSVNIVDAGWVLRFQTVVGELGVGLSHKDAANLFTLFLRQSQAVAIGKVARADPRAGAERRVLTREPIPTSGIGLAKAARRLRPC